MTLINSPHADNSPVTQDGKVNINNQASITGERTKGWFTNVLLAINIVAIVVLIFAYRHAAQEDDLKRYDLDFFVQHDFADLKTQVRTDHELIQAYGLQKSLSQSQ